MKNDPPTPRPWAFRLACLGLAGLTACAPRPRYTWRDMGAVEGGDAAAPAQDPGNWGEEADRGDDPRLAPGFLLRLRFPEDPALNGDFRVDFDGNLKLPYDVAFAAGGLTLSQAGKKVGELYKPYFKKNADVDLRIRERRRWLEVKGLVAKPCRMLVDADTSLDQVTAAAGGTLKETPPQSVRIQKGGDSFVLNLNQYFARGESHPHVLGWLGGESLFFQREPAESSDGKNHDAPFRLPIYMLGEVRRPGEYSAKPGADFVDFLVQANGFTEHADVDRIEVVRRAGGRKRAYEFSWQEFQLAPEPVQGDVLIVHADDRGFDRRIAAGTLFVSMLSTLVLIVELERDRR